MAQFFINRPIFAWVIAIVIMLGGALSIFTLPLVITILPVAYCMAFENKKRQNFRPLNMAN